MTHSNVAPAEHRNDADATFNGMNHRPRPVLRVVLIVAVCVTAAVLMADEIPLGVPGEWTWDRVNLHRDVLAGAFLSLVAGSVYISFVLLGRRRMGVAGAIERAGWLLALVFGGSGWLWVTLDSAAPPQGYARAPWVLYYPRSSGYFWQARYEVQDTATFLAGYEDLLAKQDYLHIGTHPPGLTLCYRGLLYVCQTYPRLTNAVLATMPERMRDGIDVMSELPLDGALTAETDAACLWLAALMAQLAAVLTALGIYGLAARHHDRRIAWMAACLWPLVPAIAIFLPKSDVLYPCIAVTAAWLWMSACDRQSLLRAVSAGFVLWIGMMLSLAFLTIVALVAAMTLWETWTRPAPSDAGGSQFLSMKLVLAAAAGVLVPTIALGVMADINLISVWSWNLSNHALFYEHNVRTWWKWLLVNPVELAFAAGLPIVVIALYGIGRLRLGKWRTPAVSSMMALAVVWGLLWLSGKNMGEAARLWILIMPWVVLASAHGLQPAAGAEKHPGERWGDVGVWLLTAQLIVAVVTIMRVDGFHFGELLAG